MSVSTGIDGLTSEYNSPKGERAAKRARKQRRRKNEPEEDYSEMARQRAQNSTRTGQACDRCQVSKPLPARNKIWHAATPEIRYGMQQLTDILIPIIH